MTGALVLLTGTVLTGWWGHRPLTWLNHRRLDPTILLTAWLASTVGVVLSALLPVVALAAAAGNGPESDLLRLAGGCWTALASGHLPGWRQSAAAASVVGTAVIMVRIGWAVARRLGARRRRAPSLEQLRLLAAGLPAGQPLWLREDAPIAASIGGRPGLVVLSDALPRLLSPRALAATLAHERAHLRGRHHALVAIVETLAAALPVCPLLRAAPAATRDLVELAADAAATRRCGAPAVGEALARLTGHRAPAIGLAMAARLTEARFRRLSAGSVGSRPAARLVGCLAATGAGLVVPAVVGWLALAATGCSLT